MSVLLPDQKKTKKGPSLQGPKSQRRNACHPSLLSDGDHCGIAQNANELIGVAECFGFKNSSWWIGSRASRDFESIEDS